MWKTAVRLIGCGLIGLGIVIIMTPELAAPLFATNNSSGASTTYIRAIAVRDIVIGLWLVIGPSFLIAGTTISIAAISVIPCGDLVLVWLAGGRAAFASPSYLEPGVATGARYIGKPRCLTPRRVVIVRFRTGTATTKVTFGSMIFEVPLA
jgi:hypothetical protein